MSATQLRQVDTESFALYHQGLIELLCDAVQNGASVGFLADFDEAQASAYWSDVLVAIEGASVMLWVIERDDRVVASVQLALCQKANGLNRAEVQKLLVHSTARRHGLGQQLMNTLELAAHQQRRGLLYLDTEAGSAAEAFYHSLDYTRIGELPDYCQTPNGRYSATAIYFKTLRQPA
jgi:acetyltransferase